jgi:hypothetical protein
VARNRGCLSDLSPLSARLLGLRAGIVGGAPRSAAAVARILHVNAQREAQLEHGALLALTRDARGGCPSTAVSMPVASAGRPLVTATGGPFGGSNGLTAIGGGAGSSATRSGANMTHGGSKGASGSGGSGSLALTPGFTRPAHGSKRIQRAALTGSGDPSAVSILVVCLMTAAGLAAVFVLTRRRQPAAEGLPAGDGERPQLVAAAAAPAAAAAEAAEAKPATGGPAASSAEPESSGAAGAGAAAGAASAGSAAGATPDAKPAPSSTTPASETSSAPGPGDQAPPRPAGLPARINPSVPVRSHSQLRQRGPRVALGLTVLGGLARVLASWWARRRSGPR